MSSFRLAAPDGEPLPAALPGQFLTLRLRRDAGRPPLLRTYSLSGHAGRRGVPDQREARTARRGEHATCTTKSGSARRSSVAAPRGTFTLREGENPSCSCRPGSVRRRCSRCSTRWRTATVDAEVWWLHERPQPRRARLRGREPRPARVSSRGAHAEFCYSQPGTGRSPRRGLHDPGAPVGRHARTMGIPPDAAGVPLRTGRLHGPGRGRAGRPRDRSGPHLHRAVRPRAAITPGVVTGRRASHPTHRPDRPAPARRCRSPRSNLTVNWDTGVRALLEFAEACAVPVQWSCRTGVCHTCETAVLSGSVDYSPEPVDRPGEGNALVCCSRPREDLVLDL